MAGYRSPSWEFSAHTVELLAAHGLAYSSNFMDDIRPYRHAGTGAGRAAGAVDARRRAALLVLGADWTRKIATTAEVESIWQEEFTGIRALGGSFVLTMHPQIIGRPGRLAFLDRFMGWVCEHDDVRVSTCAEIAARVA